MGLPSTWAMASTVVSQLEALMAYTPAQVVPLNSRPMGLGFEEGSNGRNSPANRVIRFEDGIWFTLFAFCLIHQLASLPASASTL